MVRILKPVLRPHPQADIPTKELTNQLNDLFARETVKAGNIEDGAVTTAAIADEAVTAAKIAAGAIDLADNSVTDAKLRDSAALSVIGNGTNATADPADLVAGTDGHVLRRSGTALAFGEVATAGLADDAVTAGKIADDAVGADQLDGTHDYTVNALTVNGSTDALVRVLRNSGGSEAYSEYGTSPSGRARVGLTSGTDDDCVIQVSPNAFITTYTAIRVDHDDGHVGILTTPSSSYALAVDGGITTDSINDDGTNVLIGKASSGLATQGVQYSVSGSGRLGVTSTGAAAIAVNRNSSDGTVIDIRQGNSTEGSIDVSGTTVSYNGAHLSRWAQLASGRDASFDPEAILPGTVMSNLDEMCARPQKKDALVHLNRVRVSNVLGDRHVTGVFSRSEMENTDTHWDFLIAQCGDYFIRIGKGIKIALGDLLISAGDGTAMPQADDVIRASTIAKVRSTQKLKIYEDGSHIVACSLLM